MQVGISVQNQFVVCEIFSQQKQRREEQACTSNLNF